VRGVGWGEVTAGGKLWVRVEAETGGANRGNAEEAVKGQGQEAASGGKWVSGTECIKGASALASSPAGREALPNPSQRRWVALLARYGCCCQCRIHPAVVAVAAPWWLQLQRLLMTLPAAAAASSCCAATCLHVPCNYCRE
jgi:hypothetical protein